MDNVTACTCVFSVSLDGEICKMLRNDPACMKWNVQYDERRSLLGVEFSFFLFTTAGRILRYWVKIRQSQ